MKRIRSSADAAGFRAWAGPSSRRPEPCNTGILPVPVRGWRDTCTDEDARVTRRSRPRGAGGDTPMRPIVLQILACALIAAGALRPGERLATAAGEAVVESVTVQPGERRVYNLSVEGDHRYLVGELGVVVHNTLPCPSGRSCRFQFMTFALRSASISPWRRRQLRRK